MTVYIPKYNIGDVFFMARSYHRFGEEEKITVDGKEYTHKPEYHEPVVKKKTIVGLEMTDSIYNGIRWRYLLSEDTKTDWASHYYEEDLDNAFHTYEEAEQVAEEYAIHKNKEYYG